MWWIEPTADLAELVGVLLWVASILSFALIHRLAHLKDNGIGPRVRALFYRRRLRLPDLTSRWRGLSEAIGWIDFRRLSLAGQLAVVASLLVDAGYLAVLRYDVYGTSIPGLAKCFGSLFCYRVAFSMISIARRSPIRDMALSTSYEMMFPYHRFWGILSLIYAIAHTVTMALPHVRRRESLGMIWLWLTHNHPRSGSYALLSVLFVTLTSSQVVRRRWYNVFVLCHVPGMLLTLFLTYLHVRSRMLFPICALALWLVDRGWRLLDRSRAEITDSSSSVGALWISVSVDLEPSASALPPGAFYHFHVPSISRWQWHPYSVMKFESPNSIQMLMSKNSRASSSFAARCGSALGRGQRNVSVTGPYGRSLEFLRHYETLVAIVGGTGISPILRYLQGLGSWEETNTRPQMIYVHWTAKIHQLPSDLLEKIDKLCLQHCQLTVYWTGKSNTYKETEEAELLDHELLPVKLSAKLVYGRMDIRSAIEESYAGKQQVVYGCGPRNLLDEVHNATVLSPYHPHFVRSDAEL